MECLRNAVYEERVKKEAELLSRDQVGWWHSLPDGLIVAWDSPEAVDRQPKLSSWRSHATPTLSGGLG